MPDWNYPLIHGQTYAIQPADNRPHFGGVFLGFGAFTAEPWLVFEVGAEGATKVRFFNPAHIKSLLPELDPRVLDAD